MSDSADCVDDLPALRAAYARFLGGGRVLLTGHSHQAWPDVAREALAQSFDDAARFVDDKWGEAVFPAMQAVGEGVLTRLGFDRGDAIAFGKSTHELGYRLLSCLPLHARPRIVTTDGEFHSLRRQLGRLAEEGVRVEWVASRPRAELADRLLEALVPGTAMLALSAVLFEDSFVVPRLGEIAARAIDVGAVVLVDAYHAFNVVPLAWGPAQGQLYVTAGGYKYAGFGEGVCWLRVPHGSTLRPVYTGWFADFGGLEAPGAEITYGPGGARFAGATFDASAFYRARAVLEHWERFGLDPAKLRAVSTRQTRRILDRLDAQGHAEAVASPRDDARRGGFVAVRAGTGAEAIVKRLRAEGVLVDARNGTLRLGPAPYLTDDEIDRGVDAVARALGGE
jgi:kynureninase